MEFIDTTTLTEQDKFLLMCLQRIEELERDVDKLKSKVRDTITRDIACVHSKTGIAVDMLAYFLKVPTHVRSACEIKKMLVEILPMYKHNWSDRLTELTEKVPCLLQVWEISHDSFDEWGYLNDTDFGNNMYAFLAALTDEEIEDYWNTYRIVWTKWRHLEEQDASE
jgi:hypothetical protein